MVERSFSYLAVPQVRRSSFSFCLSESLSMTAEMAGKVARKGQGTVDHGSRSRSQFLHSGLCAFASHLLFLWPIPESAAVAGVSQSGHQQAGKLLSRGQSSQGVGRHGDEGLNGLQPVARQGL